MPNALLPGSELERLAPLRAEAARLLRAAAARLDLSGRAQHRVIKVARTLADMAGSPALQPEHVAEAISYR